MKKYKKYFFKIFASLFIILCIYLIFVVFGDELNIWLGKNPFVASIKSIIEIETSKKSVLGLSFLTFFGNLFFVGFLGEAMLILYLNLGYNPLYIIFVLLFWSMSAQFINYGVGFFIEKKILHNFVKHNKRDFLGFLKRYDTLFIVILNILPLPSDILTLILGMIKYDFKKAMFFTFLGRLIKYIFILLLFYMLEGIRGGIF